MHHVEFACRMLGYAWPSACEVFMIVYLMVTMQCAHIKLVFNVNVSTVATIFSYLVAQQICISRASELLHQCFFSICCFISIPDTDIEYKFSINDCLFVYRLLNGSSTSRSYRANTRCGHTFTSCPGHWKTDIWEA